MKPAPALRHDRLNTQGNLKGIVLPLTLVLLVILSILGIMALRNATIGSQTMNGVRTYTVAEMAAEVGLRFCEEVAKEAENPPPVPVYGAYTPLIASKGQNGTQQVIGPNDSNGLWLLPSNWSSSGANRIVVSATQSAGQKYTYPPQCIIEKLVSTGGGGNSYLVTARGIANDANYNDATGSAATGSVIWLQSILTPSGS